MSVKSILSLTVFIIVLISSTCSASSTFAKVAPYHGEITNYYELYGDAQGYDFFSGGHATRFTQSGELAYMKFYVRDVSTISDLRLKIWSKDESTGMYNLKSTSINLRPYMGNGLNNIEFANIPAHINVVEGDSFGLFISGTGDCYRPAIATSPSDSEKHAYFRYARNPSTTWFDWYNQAGRTATISIELGIKNPDIVFFGDSIISGYPSFEAFTDQFTTLNTDRVDRTKQIAYNFNTLSGMSYQNMGVYGDSYPHMYMRFADDVIAKHPKYAVLEGGINDIASGLSASEIFSYLQSEIVDCQNAGITPVVLLVFPYGGLAADQQLQYNEYNQKIIEYHKTNTKFILVDCREALGSQTNGVWVLDSQNTFDSLHLSDAGNKVVAQSIYSAYSSYTNPVTPKPVVPKSSTIRNRFAR